MYQSRKPNITQSSNAGHSTVYREAECAFCRILSLIRLRILLNLPQSSKHSTPDDTFSSSNIIRVRLAKGDGFMDLRVRRLVLMGERCGEGGRLGCLGCGITELKWIRLEN